MQLIGTYDIDYTTVLYCKKVFPFSPVLLTVIPVVKSLAFGCVIITKNLLYD